MGPYLSLLPAEQYSDEWQLGGTCSIVSMRVRAGEGKPLLNAKELREAYRLMADPECGKLLPADATITERAACNFKVMIGQPVDIPGGAVLRTCMGAPQLKNILRGTDAEADAMVAEQDVPVLRKLAIIAKYSESLIGALA